MHGQKAFQNSKKKSKAPSFPETFCTNGTTYAWAGDANATGSSLFIKGKYQDKILPSLKEGFNAQNQGKEREGPKNVVLRDWRFDLFEKREGHDA